jgi:hypothetical protein
MTVRRKFLHDVVKIVDETALPGGKVTFYGKNGESLYRLDRRDFVGIGLHFGVGVIDKVVSKPQVIEIVFSRPVTCKLWQEEEWGSRWSVECSSELQKARSAEVPAQA